jgi:hypothetical protein
MDKPFKNSQENKEEPLKEIAKKVNTFLEPILEEKFDLKARKEYISANIEDYQNRMLQIKEKAENLGFTDINPEMAKEILEADTEYKKIKKIIDETKPENILPLDIIEEIKKLDKDGRLEKELIKVYGFKHKVDNWRYFIIYINAILPNDPFYWDQLREKSES